MDWKGSFIGLFSWILNVISVAYVDRVSEFSGRFFGKQMQ